MTQVELGDVVQITSGFAFPSSGFSTEEGMPLVRIRDVTRGISETRYVGPFDDDFVVNDGDLLVGMDGEFNAALWRGGRALLNQRVCRIVPDTSRLDFGFLRHLLPRELKAIEERTPFVTVKHLSVREIRAIVLTLPPLVEQRRIATILDKADNLRRMRQEAIGITDDLLRSVFIDIFGDPSSNPKKFELGTIRDLVASASYGTSEKASEEGGTYPILRMNNITYKGGWDFSSLKYVNLDSATAHKYLAQRGDLLFNRTNSKELVGKTAVYMRDDSMAIAGYLVRVRMNERGNSHYVSGYLNSAHGKRTLEARAKSIVGMANINAQEMQDIPLLLPPIELQDKYAHIVETVHDRLKTQEASLREAIAIQSSLRHNLLELVGT